MVPSAPEAHTAYIRYDRLASDSNGGPHPDVLFLSQEYSALLWAQIWPGPLSVQRPMLASTPMSVSLPMLTPM